MIIMVALLISASVFAADIAQRENGVNATVYALVKEHGLGAVSAAVKSSKEIHKQLANHIINNNIVGLKLAHPFGTNYQKIESFLEENKGKIDFTFPLKVDGIGTFGALNLVCQLPQCSDMLVQLLCAHGAHPNKKNDVSYPANYCLHTMVCNETSPALVQNQCKKIAHLKLAAKKYNETLYAKANRSVQINFIGNDDYKELMDGIEIKD